MEDKRAGVSAQRAEHRAEHLDQIEEALAGKPSGVRRRLSLRGV